MSHTAVSQVISPYAIEADEILEGFEALTPQKRRLSAYIFTHLTRLVGEPSESDERLFAIGAARDQLAEFSRLSEKLSAYAAQAVIPKMSEVPPERIAMSIVPERTDKQCAFLAVLSVLMLGEMLEIKTGTDCTAYSQTLIEKGDTDGATASLLVGELRSRTQVSQIPREELPFRPDDVVFSLKEHLSPEDIERLMFYSIATLGIVKAAVASPELSDIFVSETSCPDSRGLFEAAQKAAPLAETAQYIGLARVFENAPDHFGFVPTAHSSAHARAEYDDFLCRTAAAVKSVPDTQGEILRTALVALGGIAGDILRIRPEIRHRFLTPEELPIPAAAAVPLLEVSRDVGLQLREWHDAVYNDRPNPSELN